VALELDNALRKPNSTAHQIARIVRREPKILQRVWQSANSINFVEKVNTLEEAIVRVGFEPLWRMAMRACMNAPVFRVNAYQTEVNAVRGVSIVTAEVAGVLFKGGDVYIAGLLHAIGKLLVYRAGEFRTGVLAPDPATVNRIAQRYHPGIGVLIAHALKMPPLVCEGIALAPEPERLPNDDMNVTLAVRAGCIAAHTAAAARNHQDLPGIEALAHLSRRIDAGRLIARAHSAWADLESDGDSEVPTDPGVKSGRKSRTKKA